MPHSTSAVKRAVGEPCWVGQWAAGWLHRATRYNGHMRVKENMPADEQLKRERAAFFGRMEAIARRANVPDQEAEKLIADAAGETRARRSA